MSDHMTTTMLTLGESWMHRIWFRSPAATSQGSETDWLYMFIMWTCVISFIVLLIPIVSFPIKYHRSRQAKNYVQSPAHHTGLELTWSIVPLIVMVFMFFWGFQGYVSKLAAPADAEEITIKGMKWNWTPIYRNGAQTDMTTQITHTKTDVPVIYVPAGRPVKLIMTSTDVIHSFYVPDFRTKMDVFPNRYTSMWFQPEKPSTPGPNGKWINDDKNSPQYGMPYEGAGHWVFCAEYCGTQHSEMAAFIVVLPADAYEKKVYELATVFPSGTFAEAGEKIAKRKGCFQCHTTDGSKSTGPTWKNMYGDLHRYTDGSEKTVDEDWLREGILYSQKKILDGYAGQNMPVFAGQINDNELLAVISYIKTLSDKTSEAERNKANTVPDFSSEPKK